MRRSLLGLLLACSLGACEDSAPPERRSPSGGQALSAEDAPPPRLALLATRPGASESTLHFVEPGAASAPAAVATLPHAPDGEVRGALLPGGQRVVVVADVERRTDPSFGAWLFAVEPGHAPKALAKGCAHASRPVVLASGRVLVQRGAAGPALEAEQRTDSLTLDEVDPQSGTLRTVHAFQGYITHIAGVLDAEVFVYRVAHQAADLVAIDVASGALRVLASPIPAQARDFSVDPSSRSLVYANHDGSGWLVERLALDSGARQELARAAGMWVTPSVWPGGGVLVNDGRGAVLLAGTGPNRPLGPGFDEVRSVSSDGRHVALLHRIPSQLSQVFVTRSDGAKVTRVPAPGDARLEIAGFLP